jgi:hypothetical protein
MEIDFSKLGNTRREFESSGTVVYELPAGSAGLHHPRLPHCSRPNTAEIERRVFFLVNFLKFLISGSIRLVFLV